MHVIDSDAAARIEAQDKLLQYQFAQAESARFETRHRGLVGTVTNIEHQRGKQLTTTQFMIKLRKLNKDLFIIPHPNQMTDYVQRHTGLLYFRCGDINEYLMACEYDWMPEWTCMTTTEARRPVDSDAGYWQKETIVGREQRRGWRTILYRLLKKGLITLEATEREFGAGNRPSWARLKQKVEVPI